MKTRLSLAVLAAALSANVASAQTLEERISALESRLQSGTKVDIGGYIKLDAQVSRFSDGNRATATIGDDYLVPSTIPVGGESGGAHTDFSAKESRFWLKTSTQTDYGKLGTHIEVDFSTQSMGDERISNSYAPRIRHAYLTFNDWLMGQTWTTFFDVAALPDLLDFVGPAGTTFGRQAQIRYSPGQWDFAMENPSTTLYDTNGLTPGAGSSYDDNRVPDLIVRYRMPVGKAHYSLAAMGRELAYRDGTGSRESEYGYGVNFSGKIPVGDRGNDIRVQLTGGNAIGRYIALNGFRSGEIEADGSIEPIDTWGAMLAYRHLWSDQWRSSVSASVVEADNPDTVAAGVAKAYRTAHVNLIYTPVARLELGGELIWGERENESGDKGDVERFQFSAKLAF